MQRFLQSIAVAALAAAALSAAGCNYLIPGMWIVQGAPKKPAAYTLPKDRKLVVFVDDRKNVVSRLQLRAMLADDVGTVIMKEGLVEDVVSGRELISYVRRNETSSKRVSIEELGNTVGAELVLYIEMETFALSVDGASPKPRASVFVKVVDCKAKERLFPPVGADPKGFAVSAELIDVNFDAYKTSATRRALEDQLEKKLADMISKTFYDHEEKAFGQGVSTPR